MTIAFVLGNGQSRQAVDLSNLAVNGTVYGCNAIYRDFEPAVLISTDTPISTRIQEQGVSQKLRHYTRRPLPNSGSQRIPSDWFGFSSGPVATALACQDGHHVIYLVGFDLGALDNNRFNNVYADTEFYKKSSSRPTFTGNWIKQLCTVAKRFPRTNFIRIMGKNTADIPEFSRLGNWACLPMDRFLERVAAGKNL